MIRSCHQSEAERVVDSDERAHQQRSFELSDRERELYEQLAESVGLDPREA
jgi:hypothetical protein